MSQLPSLRLGLPSLRGSKSSAVSLAERYPEEEQESFLRQIGRGALSGVQMAGNILDAPGGAVRALIAGENPLEAFFDPDERPSGRDLLEQYGMLDRNTPGLDWGDAAGFMAEVGLDPLLPLRGPGAAITKLGKSRGLHKGALYGPRAIGSRKTAGHLASPSRRIEELLAGERALLAYQLPFTKTPLVTFGTGERAAKAVDAFWYGNPLTRWTRHTFSTIPNMKASTTAAAQRGVDAAWDISRDNIARLQDYQFVFRHRISRPGGIEDIYDNVFKNVFRAFPDRLQPYIGGSPNIADIEDMGVHDFIRAAAEARVKEPDLALGAIAPGPKTLTDLFKQTPILKDVMEGTASVAQIARLTDKVAGAETLMDAAKFFDDTIDHMLKTKDEVYAMNKALGLHSPELEDMYAGHMPRRIPAAMRAFFGKRGLSLWKRWKKGGLYQDNALPRADELRGIPGASWTINRISKDPNVSATASWSEDTGKMLDGQPWNTLSQEVKDEKMAYIKTMYDIPDNWVKREGGTGVGPPSAMIEDLSGDHDLDRLAKFFHELPVKSDAEKAWLHEHGLFSRAPADDILEYVENGLQRNLAARTSLMFIGHAASDMADGISVKALVKDGLGLSDNALDELTGMGVDVTNSFVPREMVDVVKKINDFHGSHATQEGFLGGFDKVHGWFKGGVTIPFPAFHSRNLVSGFWQNAVTAFKNPAQAVRTGKMMWDVLHGKDVEGPRGLGSLIDLLRSYDVIPTHKLRPHDLAEKAGLVKDITDLSHLGGTTGPRAILGRGAKVAMETGEALKTNPLKAITKPITGGTREVFDWGEDMMNMVEAYNRGTHFIAQIENGMTASAASMSTMANHFDYSAVVKSHPLQAQVLKRVIPFYCVPDHSEILTRRGWKDCDSLQKGEEVLTYNQDADCHEWQPCLDVNVFAYDQPIMVMESKTHRYEFTPNHRWVTKTAKNTVRHPWGTYFYPGETRVVEGKDLSHYHRIIQCSQLHESESCLTPEQARLLGWIITDGHHRHRKNYVEAVVYQSPKKHLEEVTEVAGGKPRAPHPTTGVVCVPVEIQRKEEVQEYLDPERLQWCVCHLSRQAAEAMWEAMLKADGCRNPQRGVQKHTFMAAQKPHVKNAAVILATILGKRIKEGSRGFYVSSQQTLKVASCNIHEEHYKGRVWCPTTKNGTWVMRQHGRVTITGNSWLRFNTPHQFSELIHRPGGRTAQTVRFMSDLIKETENTEYIPAWLREKIAIPAEALGLSPAEPGSSKFVSFSGFLPIEDALNRFPASKQPGEWAHPDTTRIFQKFMSMTDPITQTFLEKATGTQLWTGRPKAEVYQQPFEAAWMNDLIHHSPISRVLSTFKRSAPEFIGRPMNEITGGEWWDDRKTTSDRLVNFLIGGVKVSDIDQEKGIVMEGRRLIEDLMQPQREVRKFSRLYVKPEDLKDLTAEETRLWSLYQYLLARQRKK